MKKYIMALDQGTTSSRCIIYDKKGNMMSVAQKEFTQKYPKDGWVEHDAMEIWSTQMGVAQEALLKIGCTYKNIEAIGITNQRETTVVWDKDTGEPVYNAIVWQCRRTAEYCDRLSSDRCLFQRDKAQMDTGKRAGRTKEGRRRPAALWHHRDMAHMEDDRGKGPRH